jgi:N-acetylmuramoyl-L-alanine amidase
VFKPSHIVVHHSATPDGLTNDWESIRRYHTHTKGWNQIGYHFGLERINGVLTLLKGRPIGSVGAHAIGFNAKSIGICVVGNFDAEVPDSEQMETLSAICVDLQRQFDIPRKNVIGHRETYVLLGVPVQKTCPGKLFSMDLLRERLIDL